MSNEIPDYVRLACRRWGRQKRRIWRGEEWYINSEGKRVHHIDGYASSLLGRIREEREGAGQSIISQKWDEVYWGDGLDVRRCLPGMPERPLAVLHLQYVWDPEFAITASRKAALLEMSLANYWSWLKNAEFWVFARLDRLDASNSEIPQENPEKVLQMPKNEVKRKTNTVTSPYVSFESLQRSKLTVSK